MVGLEGMVVSVLINLKGNLLDDVSPYLMQTNEVIICVSHHNKICSYNREFNRKSGYSGDYLLCVTLNILLTLVIGAVMIADNYCSCISDRYGFKRVVRMEGRVGVEGV